MVQWQDTNRSTSDGRLLSEVSIAIFDQEQSYKERGRQSLKSEASKAKWHARFKSTTSINISGA